jgi:hypothetical protein
VGVHSRRGPLRRAALPGLRGGRRFWIERRPKESCPACGGQLRETEERRRETKGGFACREDCQTALTRKLTTLAEHTYVLPSRLSLREFLLKVWLPATESRVRETTLSGYRMLVEQRLVPQLGAVQLRRSRKPGCGTSSEECSACRSPTG